jgi:hypothetical protein
MHTINKVLILIVKLWLIDWLVSNANFSSISAISWRWYHGIRFHFNGWTREYPVKTTEIQFVTDNIYYTTLYRVHLTTSSMFLIYTICSLHDIAEILLKFALDTNQSINQRNGIECHDITEKYLKLAASSRHYTI